MKNNSLIPTYPQVGDVIYWKDEYEGNMHEDTVLKIEDEIYLYIEYDGYDASFVTIYDILDPLSEEVQEFRNRFHKEKMDNVMKMINTPEIYCELRKRLSAVYGNEAANILKVLTNENQ